MNNLAKFGEYQTDIPDKTYEQKHKESEIKRLLSLIRDIGVENNIELHVSPNNRISFGDSKVYFDSEDLAFLAENIRELEKLDE